MPIELSEISALIGVLADSLGDAVTTSEVPSSRASSNPSLMFRVKKVFRPSLAKIVHLRVARDNQRPRTASK
jgi:hypothetical protein